MYQACCWRTVSRDSIQERIRSVHTNVKEEAKDSKEIRTSNGHIRGNGNTPLEGERGNLLEATLTSRTSDERLPIVSSEEQVLDRILAVGDEPFQKGAPFGHHGLPSSFVIPSLQSPAIQEVRKIQWMLSVVVPAADRPLRGVGQNAQMTSVVSNMLVSNYVLKLLEMLQRMYRDVRCELDIIRNVGIEGMQEGRSELLQQRIASVVKTSVWNR